MQEAPQFAPYVPMRAFQEIADQIKKVILQRKLKPGERLPSERVLAEQFQVGRLTIREALRSLETSGIITIKKGSGGGAFVRDKFQTSALASIITDNFILEDLTIREITEARVALECASAEYATSNAREEDLQAIEDYLQELHGIFNQAQPEVEIVPKLIRFHILLAKASRNIPIYLFMQAVMEWAPQCRKTLQSWHPTLEQRQTALKYFSRILEAIRQKDAQSARKLVKDYIYYIDQILSDPLDAN